MILQILFGFILHLPPIDSGEVKLHLSTNIQVEHIIPYSPEDEDDDYDLGWLRFGFCMSNKIIEPEINIFGIGVQYSQNGLVPNDDDYLTYTHKHSLKKKHKK